jgi:glycosyltransferase involved in cell wall biosynthesis
MSEAQNSRKPFTGRCAMQDHQILCEQLAVRKKSLRIAVVTETYPPEINGVALTIARFVEELQALDHEIQLIRPKQGVADGFPQSGSTEQVLMQGMAIPRYPSLRMGLPAPGVLARHWTRRRPDLVHIVTEGPLGWSALRAAQKLRLPVTSDFRTNFHAYSRHYGIGWLSKPIAAYLRKFHNRTRLTMVPTEAMRQELAVMGILNGTVVARGVDTNLFNPARRSEELRRQWGAAPEDPVVLHVGRLASEKNLPVLNRAYAAMRQSNRKAKLVLVGDGPERAQVLAAQRDAIYAGMRKGEDLATHYASADVFLFPSTTETFGNVTVEALASGLATVAYDYAAAAEHIIHDESGLLVPFDADTLFVQQSAALACDAERIARLRIAARQAAAPLDWKKVVARMETLLLSVVGAENAWPEPGAGYVGPTLATRS